MTGLVKVATTTISKKVRPDLEFLERKVIVPDESGLIGGLPELKSCNAGLVKLGPWIAELFC